MVGATRKRPPAKAWTRRALGWGLLALIGIHAGAAPVRIATFNVQNYLCMDRRLEGRFSPKYPKPEVEKTAVRAAIRAVHPDVLCLQEIGTRPFLAELQQDLAREGARYDQAVLLDAADPLRHVAILARLPLHAVVEHTDLTFDYLGRTECAKRGLLEIQFNNGGTIWRVFVVHLKSPLTADADDPLAEKRRIAEAHAVRERILRQVAAEARPLFAIVGDMNAAPDSRTLATLTRAGRGLAVPLDAFDSRGEVWTHVQARSGRYERVDYILVSPALLPGVSGGRATIHDADGATGGSDHRLVWAEIDASLALTFGAEFLKTETPAGAKPAGVEEEE